MRNDGHLYGRRIVLPLDQDSPEARYVTIDGRQVFVAGLGDSALVPMNWSEQQTLQAKLTARLGQQKLTLSGVWQNDQGQNYNHLFRYNPDGIPTVYGYARSLLAIYTHVFSPSTFAELKGAYFTNEVREFVYEDPLDPRYPRDDALRILGGNFAFYRGGAIMRHFRRKTETFTARLDLTSQVTRRHQVKTGVEFKQHTLTVRDFSVKRNPSTGFQPAIPPEHTPDHVFYHKRPIELSAYVQDKMEFEYLVVNVGLRFDYFDPRGRCWKISAGHEHHPVREHQPAGSFRRDSGCRSQSAKTVPYGWPTGTSSRCPPLTTCIPMPTTFMTPNGVSVVPLDMPA